MWGMNQIKNPRNTVPPRILCQSGASLSVPNHLRRCSDSVSPGSLSNKATVSIIANHTNMKTHATV